MIPADQPCTDCGDRATRFLRHDLSLCDGCARTRYGAAAAVLGVPDEGGTA